MDDLKSGQRRRNLFNPQSSKPYKLSRARLENFIRCPRCFYLDRRHGVDQPPTFPFNLNNAVDLLLKKEFDAYRRLRKPHPLMVKHGVDAIPLNHPDIDKWRNRFGGVQYLHPETNFILTGILDDVWVNPEGELIIVDYKATSQEGDITLSEAWKISYKRQIEIYQWLVKKNGFPVSDRAYFVYCNGSKSAPGFFNRLLFTTVILPYEGSTGWIEGVLLKAHACLMSDLLPDSNPGCDFCAYRIAARKTEFQNEASQPAAAGRGTPSQTASLC